MIINDCGVNIIKAVEERRPFMSECIELCSWSPKDIGEVGSSVVAVWGHDGGGVGLR